MNPMENEPKKRADDGGKAFPSDAYEFGGMSLRAYFACHFAAGMLSESNIIANINRIALEQADDMIRRLKNS